MYNQLQEKRNEIKKAKYIIRALDHSLRQMIIKKVSEDGRASVTDLYVFLRLEQSVCSQHLGVLRRAGILTTEREGKSIFYSIDEKVATHVLDSITRLTNVSH